MQFVPFSARPILGKSSSVGEEGPVPFAPCLAFYNQRKINGLQKAKHRLAFSRLQMKAAKKKVRHCLTFLAILDKSHLSQRMALP